RWPEETGTLLRLGHENLDAIERFVQQNELDVEWERTGVLNVANEPYQREWLGESTDPEVETLDAEATRARINSPTFLGADFSPRENALVHPAKLAAELARHAHS